MIIFNIQLKSTLFLREIRNYEKMISFYRMIKSNVFLCYIDACRPARTISRDDRKR